MLLSAPLSILSLVRAGVIAIVRVSFRRRAVLAVHAILLITFALFFIITTGISHARPAGRFSWPVSGPVIKSFSKPTGPYGEGGHQGVDISARPGTEVRASCDGTVAWVGELPRGRFVSISHEGGIRTTYLDLDRIDVSQGGRVRGGQIIGTVNGTRDDSSSESHLHFDVFVNGVPVDPHMLIDGFDAGSFIRLCPTERREAHGRSPGLEDNSGPGLLQRFGRTLKSAFSQAARPLADAWRSCVSGCASGRDALVSTARFIARGAAGAWNRGIVPAFRRAVKAVAGGLGWVWNNRWVQAVVAGVAAAIVVVVVIVAAVVVAGLSAVVATIAALAAVVACIVTAIVYAAMHPVDFSFAQCFYKSLAAGCVAAGLAGSTASLFTAFAAGWVELGLLGTVKSAFWSGFYSLCFDTSWSYLFTGQISWRKALVAFGVGAFSGAVGKLLIKGIRSSHRVVEIMAFGSTGFRQNLLQLGRSTVMVLEGVSVKGFLVSVKSVAISLGVKVAYVGFSGTFATGVHAVTCAITGTPVTLSGSLAAFLAGGLMGAVALTFKARGIGGMLGKLHLFRDGRRARLKGLVAAFSGKLLRKGLNTGSRSLFRRIFKEEVAE